MERIPAMRCERARGHLRVRRRRANRDARCRSCPDLRYGMPSGAWRRSWRRPRSEARLAGVIAIRQPNDGLHLTTEATRAWRGNSAEW